MSNTNNNNNKKGKLLMSFLIVFLSSIFLTYSTDISSCGQLEDIALTGDHQLVNDIDCNDDDFTPIGSKTSPFKGYLEGNGNTISNLNINNSDSDYTGLFGYIKKDAEKSKDNIAIQNLKIDNITVLGKDYTGSIAGAIKGASIKNIEIFNGKVEGSSVYVGGLFGLIEPVETFGYDINIEGISGDVDVSTIDRFIYSNDLNKLRTDLNFNFEIIEECDEKTLFYIEGKNSCLNEEYFNYDFIREFLNFNSSDLESSLLESVNDKYYTEGKYNRNNLIDEDYGNGIFGSINGKFIQVDNYQIKIEYYTKEIINRNKVSQTLNIKTCENFADLIDVTKMLETHHHQIDISLVNNIDCEGKEFNHGFNNVKYFFGNGNTLSNFKIKSTEDPAAFIRRGYYVITDFENNSIKTKTDTLEDGTDVTYFGNYDISGIVTDLTLDNVEIFGPNETSFFGYELNIKLDNVAVENSKVYSDTDKGTQLYKNLPPLYAELNGRIYKFLSDIELVESSSGKNNEVFHNNNILNDVESKDQTYSSDYTGGSGSSSSGGSSGSSSKSMEQYLPLIKEKLSFNLKKRTTLKLNIENDNKVYELVFTKLNKDDSLKIKENGNTKEVQIGYENNLDVDNDGNDDYKITIKSLVDKNNIEIEILNLGFTKEVKEEIVIPEVVDKEETPDKKDEGTPSSTQPANDNDYHEEDGESFPWLWVIIIAILIIAGATFAITKSK